MKLKRFNHRYNTEGRRIECMCMNTYILCERIFFIKYYVYLWWNDILAFITKNKSFIPQIFKKYFDASNLK